MTVGRVYCERETRDAYEQMWTLFWETVGRITGKPVKFRVFSGDGEGIRAILVDGNKPQVDGLGAYLVKYNRQDISGISESDPQRIVEYIVKVCLVHFDR